MDICSPKAIEIILTFAVGGITLRGLIAIIKNYFRLTGLLVVLLGLALCAVGSAIYMLVTNSFSWVCLLFYTAEVFAGTQIVYRATHKYIQSNR